MPAALAQAIEATRLRLLSAGLLGRRGVTLALVGSGRGAGVSTLAIGLAHALRQGGDGRVLLIDGTPLGRRAGTMLGQHGAALAVAEMASQPPQLEAAVQHLEGPGFDLLTLADAPDAGLRDAARPAWDALRGAYDAVIVDGGSISTDTPFRWGSWVDHSAIVLDTERVTREMMAHQRRALELGQLRLAGFILNKREFHVPSFLYRALG